jgi:DNA adenine methylase
MNKQVLKYTGGKWRIAEWVIKHFPPHKVYVEACFGSGAIFFTKQPSLVEIINDLDGDVVNLFKACRDYPKELATLIKFTPLARDEYYSCCEKRKTEGMCLERARQIMVAFWQRYKMADGKTWQVAQNDSCLGYLKDWEDLPNRILNVTDRLKHAQIENCNCIDLIKRCNDPDTFIYIDPPYVQSLCSKNLYKFEMNDNLQMELLKTIKESKSKILISAYDNELYNRELEGWGTDTISNTNRNGAVRIEKVYYNYKNQTLFDL